jgi:hypothetical protein
MLRSPEDSDNDFAWVVFYSQEYGNASPYLTIRYSNGTTAVIALNDMTANTDLSFTTTCNATSDGLSFCGLTDVMSLPTE